MAFSRVTTTKLIQGAYLKHICWNSVKVGYPRLYDLLIVCGLSTTDQIGVRYCVQNSIDPDRDDYNGYPYIEPIEPEAYYFCDDDDVDGENIKYGTFRQATELCKTVMTPMICSNRTLSKTLRTSYWRKKTNYFRAELNSTKDW